jgi:hypothetical protein
MVITDLQKIMQFLKVIYFVEYKPTWCLHVINFQLNLKEIGWVWIAFLWLRI